MTPRRSALPASSLKRVLIALVTFSLLAVSLTSVVMAKPGGGNPGGNSTASAACENGGYLNWTRANGTTFRNEGDCTKYAAKGGALVAVVPSAPTLTLSPGEEVTGTPYLKNYDFGLVAGVTQTFTVTNTATAPSQLLFLSAPPPAFDGSDPFCAGQILAPNATCTFDVTFTPPVCNAGDQFSGRFDVLGIDPATGTPDDRYIRLNVDGSCPNLFSVVYSSFEGVGFSAVVSGAGLEPASLAQFRLVWEASGLTRTLQGPADLNGNVVLSSFPFFDPVPCLEAGNPVNGAFASGIPAGGVLTGYTLPLPDATICSPAP